MKKECDCRKNEYCEVCTVLNETTVSSSDLSAVLDGLDGVEVMDIDKYRSHARVKQDYDRARVVIELEFPRHLNLYHKLKKMAD